MYRFDPPRTSSACTAFSLGDAKDGDSGKIIMKFRVTWGHASAQQLGRVLVDSDRGNMRAVNYLDGPLGHREVRRASDKAPRVLVAGTSSASISDEKLGVLE